MSNGPLMPKATAVWLIDNTSLSFEQIARFCNLHALEVKGIADGDVAFGIKGMDPISSGQLTRDELEAAQADPDYELSLAKPKVEIPEVKTKRGPRYTPVSRRQERPDAIFWLLKNHPELTDGQIIKLVGTTKPTIKAIRDRTHWNSTNIKAVDPVTLSLCSQIDLDGAVQKAARKAQIERQKLEKEAARLGTILPAEQTIAPAVTKPEYAEIISSDDMAKTSEEPSARDVFASQKETEKETTEEQDDQYDAASVFAKLSELKSSGKEAEEEDE